MVFTEDHQKMFLEIQGKLVDPLSRNLDLKELTKSIQSNAYFGGWITRDDGKLECDFRCISMFFPWYNNMFADLCLENVNGDNLEPFKKLTITEDMIDKESFCLLTMMAKDADDDSCGDYCDHSCDEQSDDPSDDAKPDFNGLLAELKYEGGTMLDYVQKYADEFETIAESFKFD